MKAVNRYKNCRFWGAGRIHAFFFAVFIPSHADKNLNPVDD